MTPIPPTEPSFTGFRFALLSRVSRVTDAALERIQQGCTLILSDVCTDYKLAPCGIRIMSDVSELKRGEVLTTFEENIGDPQAAAFHTWANGSPIIRVAAGAGTSAKDWENDGAHETVETALDSDVSTYKIEQRADGTVRLHSFEGCDRTQGLSFKLDLGSGDPYNAPNVLLSAYWNQQPNPGAKLDLMGNVESQFQLMQDSYGVYILGTGSDQQEASGNLAREADRIRSLAPQDRVVIAGSIPADKLQHADARILRRIRDAHAYARNL